MLRRKLIISQLIQLPEACIGSQQCTATARGLAVQFSSLAAAGDAISAKQRDASGTSAAVKLRKSGRIPGTMFSMPGEEHILLSFDKNEVAKHVQKLGRTGWACHMFSLHVEGKAETFPVLGRQVHINPGTQEIENVTLMHCPPDRQIRLKVPLKVYGEEICPGLKAGGRINWISRTVPCVAHGAAEVPQGFEVDISRLEITDKLLYRDLQLPEGVELMVKDLDLPIIKIMKR